MFRVKTTTRRHPKQSVAPNTTPTNTTTPSTTVVLPDTNSFEKNLNTFFEAESSAASTTKPWLRLERGIRLQKLRAYAEEQTEYTVEERDILNKMLVKANDAKLLNTKQQIQYENGKILNICGLKPFRNEDGILDFKIEVARNAKKKTETLTKNE